MKEVWNIYERGKVVVIGHSYGSKGWGSGESVCLPQVCRGSNPGVDAMWVDHVFVVGFLLCSERFFSGYSGFSLSSKTNIFKFQFDLESGRRRTTMWMCYLQIIIYLFILSFIIIDHWPKTVDKRNDNRLWKTFNRLWRKKWKNIFCWHEIFKSCVLYFKWTHNAAVVH